MTVKEVQAVIEAQYETHQDIWNQTRFIAFIQACSAGAKLSKPEDLIKFAWDIETPEVLQSPEELLKSQYDLINAMQNPDKQVFKPLGSERIY